MLGMVHMRAENGSRAVVHDGIPMLKAPNIHLLMAGINSKTSIFHAIEQVAPEEWYLVAIRNSAYNRMSDEPFTNFLDARDFYFKQDFGWELFEGDDPFNVVCSQQNGFRSETLCNKTVISRGDAFLLTFFVTHSEIIVDLVESVPGLLKGDDLSLDWRIVRFVSRDGKTFSSEELSPKDEDGAFKRFSIWPDAQKAYYNERLFTDLFNLMGGLRYQEGHPIP